MMNLLYIKIIAFLSFVQKFGSSNKNDVKQNIGVSPAFLVSDPIESFTLTQLLVYPDIRSVHFSRFLNIVGIYPLSFILF